MPSQPWRVELSRRAAKALRQVPLGDQARIRAAIEHLAAQDQVDVRKLRGEQGRWRLRVGTGRVQIEPVPVTRTLLVAEIKRRQDDDLPPAH